MVLDSHALQRGYRPDERTDWFATAYVDDFRWVMPTIVVGTSQHAGYWAVTYGHRNLLARNNRTRRSVSTMDRLTDLEAVLEQEWAREF